MGSERHLEDTEAGREPLDPARPGPAPRGTWVNVGPSLKGPHLSAHPPLPKGYCAVGTSRHIGQSVKIIVTVIIVVVVVMIINLRFCNRLSKI